MKKKKHLLIFDLKLEDYLILAVLALGVLSTFYSNKEIMGVALVFLILATVMYLIASTYARRVGGGNAVGFTRALNSFVSGLLFLVAPSIFFYHWGYNGPFQSAVLLVFILCGIFRISAFNYFGSRQDAHKYYYVGMPVFWSPVIVLAAYILGKFIDAGIVHALVSVSFAVFSALMLVNVEIKFLHKPASWIKKAK
jgi:CDP-diacylglycerol--serine O-phosphatidyltransferase